MNHIIITQDCYLFTGNRCVGHSLSKLNPTLPLMVRYDHHYNYMLQWRTFTSLSQMADQKVINSTKFITNQQHPYTLQIDP